MKWIFILFLLFLISPVTALLPPVEDPDIPVCGDVNFFFWNDSSDFGAMYNKFSTYPQLQDASIYSGTVSSATGEKTIGSFVTDAFPNGKILAPGLTRYRVYLNTTSDVGVTTFNFIPYNVSPAGVETRMFFGVPRSVDINTQIPTEFLISYARRNYTDFLPGERLLIKVNISTTSVIARTGSISIAGTSYASMGTIGYWQCEETQPNYAYQPPTIPLTPFAACVAFAVMCVIIARRKHQ